MTPDLRVNPPKMDSFYKLGSCVCIKDKLSKMEGFVKGQMSII